MPQKRRRPVTVVRRKHRSRRANAASPEGTAEDRIKEALRKGSVSLNLQSLELQELPASIAKLEKLRELNLNFNRLKGLPTSISRLKRLRVIGAFQNELTTLPDSLSDMVSLVSLAVHRNRIARLPDSIGNLKNLEVLDIGDNALTSLPDSIGGLTSLRSLNLYGNQLTDLPESFGALRHLRTLYLTNNRFKTLPQALERLDHLQHLSLANNKLTELPAFLGQLKRLTGLLLENNELSAIPESLIDLAELGTLKMFLLNDNPLLGVPVEIIGPSFQDIDEDENATVSEDDRIRPQDPRRIARYFRQLMAGPTQPLNEAKVLVVGPGGHGKSSLVEYLRDGTFQQGKKTTEGITVAPWILPATAVQPELRLNVWDFGGQEIQHSTHEFFLTERAVYLLVFQPRDDQATAQGLYYWLDLIHLIAPNAPVIVALSKQDEYEGYVNDAGDLKRLHDKIVDFVPISCVEGERFSDNAPRLRELVLDTVCREIGHIRYRLPVSWMQVKADLEKPGLEHLSYAEYQRICEANGIIDVEDQKLLARFLNDLGTMLNYSDRMPLEQTHILSPAWVTEGVYAVVLSRELRDARGEFDEELLCQLLDHPKYQGRYSLEAQRFILQMMLSFKLCYELTTPGGHRRYLVPNALPDEPPSGADVELTEGLRFEIRFPRILPTSVMSRFIVAMHSRRAEDLRWRLGLRSQLMGHDLLVTAHPKEKRIRIRVGGIGPTRARALEVVRQHFAAICREKEGLAAREYTFPPEHPNAEPYPFENLLEAERNQIATIWLAGGIGNISVRDWLDGVTDPESRRRLQEVATTVLQHGGVVERGPLTYVAHAEHVGGTDMSQQQNYTQNISGGTFTNSPVAIQQMLQNSFNMIEGGARGEVRTALQELHRHVATLLESKDVKDPEVVRDDLQSFVKEATRPQPRRKWLEISGEGLVEAAKAVGSMAPPIIAAVRSVTELLVN